MRLYMEREKERASNKKNTKQVENFCNTYYIEANFPNM